MKEEKPARIRKPSGSAGGPPAVYHALKYGVSEMGVKRSFSTLSRVNQTEGFDCPGCAWPDPDHRRSMIEFCENGAKAVAHEATLKRADPELFSKYTIHELRTKSDHWLESQGRLTHPMILKKGSDRYEPIAWEEAFALISAQLRELTSPDEALFYTSGRTSNEAAFLYQLFVRHFGTNNLPDCSNLCHESSGVGLTEVIGSGKGTVTLEDFDHADCIIVMGQNPGTNHPRMLTTLQAAARRGARIISVNPLRETGLCAFRHPQELSGWVGAPTSLTSLFLQIRVNGDVALLKGWIKAILEMESRDDREIPDRSFISSFTTGFEDFLRDIESTSWEAIVQGSGIPRTQIEEAARIYRSASRVIVCWAMGLTQHKNAVSNIQMIVNLLLLGGHFGRKGAGACPVRGHSNVQGDRTMGIRERPTEKFLSRLDRATGIRSPRKHGLGVLPAIFALHEGRARFFFAMGGNFAAATPDPHFTWDALSRAEMTVQVSTRLNRSHVIPGKTALILPCLARTERDEREGSNRSVTCENSMGVVHRSQGNLEPASPHILSEVAIVCRLALALFGDGRRSRSRLDWGGFEKDYRLIRILIAEAIEGFENFEERVSRPGGFSLPHAVRDERRFGTPDGKARFTIHPIPETPEPGKGFFLLTTLRSHDQFNTTIYGQDDRYRGIYEGRRVVLMNGGDIRDLGLKSGDRVDLVNHVAGERSGSARRERRARGFQIVPYDIPAGNVGAYFPEANEVVPIEVCADLSETPISKSVPVRIEKSHERVEQPS